VAYDGDLADRIRALFATDHDVAEKKPSQTRTGS